MMRKKGGEWEEYIVMRKDCNEKGRERGLNIL